MTARRDRPSSFRARAERAVGELALAIVSDPRATPEDVAEARAALLPRARLDRRAVAAMSPAELNLLRGLQRQALGLPLPGGDRVADLAAQVGRDGVNAFGWRSPDARRSPEPAEPIATPEPVAAPVDPDDLGSWPWGATQNAPPAPAPPAPQRPAGPLDSVFKAARIKG